MGKSQSLFLVLFLVAFACACTGCGKGEAYYNPDAIATYFDGEQYVGSNTCMECHAKVYASHIQTAHYNTSALANAESIHGSFEKGSNTIELTDIEVAMLKKLVNGKESFVQQKVDKQTNKELISEKMDIVIGSGIKGQSYLTWEEDKLFQLQASYFPPTENWINSPGYPPQNLTRPIRDGCLKCHVTFAKNMDFSGQGNRYDKTQMVYGIDCERCHTPSKKHVVFHRNNPEIKEAKFMMKLDTLSRQQRLDACAQCHSGPRANIIQGNSFSFQSGDILKEYSRNFYTGQKSADLDVHGNQYGLLTSSECFIQSKEMDCVTCHDPHKKQRGNTAYFNEKCMTCHTTNTIVCKAEPGKLEVMGNNCIACHMPNEPSKLMSVQLTSDSIETPVMVRTHLIKVYLEDLYESE